MRVENVCSRLGLQSLAYLWQEDRYQLVSKIIDSGIHAITVKVAGAGLDPARHLGNDLATLLPVLKKFNRMYGLDMCGEGGQFPSYSIISLYKLYIYKYIYNVYTVCTVYIRSILMHNICSFLVPIKTIAY